MLVGCCLEIDVHLDNVAETGQMFAGKILCRGGAKELMQYERSFVEMDKARCSNVLSVVLVGKTWSDTCGVQFHKGNFCAFIIALCREH